MRPAGWNVNVLESGQPGNRVEAPEIIPVLRLDSICAWDKKCFADSALCQQDYTLIPFQQQTSFCDLIEKIQFIALCYFPYGLRAALEGGKQVLANQVLALCQC